MAVDLERIIPVRALTQLLLGGCIWRNAKVWLSVLVAANIAYGGVALTSQGDDLDSAREPPPTEMRGLRLVSEMALGNAPIDPPQQFVCHSWGPFSNIDDIAETRARIDALGGVGRVRQSAVLNDPDYLVYAGRRGEAENARRTLQELKSQGIESALIIRGPLNNTLFVGVFSRVDRANAQRERVAKLGYEVAIEEIDRSYDVFHLEARVPVGFDPGEAPNAPCADIAQAHWFL